MNMTQRVLQFAGPMVVGLLIAAPVTAHAAWRQWGHDPQHSNFTNAQGQALDRTVVDLVYDPFVAQEQAEQGGDLLTHYQAPLTEDNAVFMAFQTGTWLPCDPPESWVDPAVHCGPNAWETKIWNEKRLEWEHGTLLERWNFASDWKPEPNGGAAGLGGWEPVFHPILGNLFFVYVPGASGTMCKVNKFTGDMIKRINPFDGMDPHTFVSGMPVADNRGNMYYNVIQLAAAPNPWSVDVVEAWLIKVDFFDQVSKVRYRDLIPDAPTMCLGSFSPALLPWPPAPDAQPALIPCGAQRPGVNVGPAIARDGTIYTLSRSHLSSFYAYVVAV